MQSIQFTSGDLLADRRADYAEMLAEAGEHAAAADLMCEALSIAPSWAAGWFRRGEMLETAGDVAAAVDAWREALRLDPADRLGASLKLGLHGAAHAIDAPPSAFVETLFDQYAGDFDSALVERLAYRAPELLFDLLQRSGAVEFAHVVDLGCGTGLMAERLRAAASFIEGLDLSAGMLRKAQAKGVYDRLEKQDLQLWQPEPGRADLVVAADVFNYVGALDRMIVAAHTALAPGGRFAFTVELLRDAGDFALRPSRRYAHASGYVSGLLSGAGFVGVTMEEIVLRHDRGESVEGLAVLATKPARPLLPAVEADEPAVTELHSALN